MSAPGVNSGTASASPLTRQLSFSPMMVLAIRIEHPLDVAVQSSRDANPARSEAVTAWG